MPAAQSHQMKAPHVYPPSISRGSKTKSIWLHSAYFSGRSMSPKGAHWTTARMALSAATCDSGSLACADADDCRRAGEAAVRQKADAHLDDERARLAHRRPAGSSTVEPRLAAPRSRSASSPLRHARRSSRASAAPAPGRGSPPPAGSCLLSSAAMSSGLNSGSGCSLGSRRCSGAGFGLGRASGCGGSGARGSATRRRRRASGARVGQRLRLSAGIGSGSGSGSAATSLRLGLGFRLRLPAPAVAEAAASARAPPRPASRRLLPPASGAGVSASTSGFGCGFSSGSTSRLLVARQEIRHLGDAARARPAAPRSPPPANGSRLGKAMKPNPRMAACADDGDSEARPASLSCPSPRA